MKEELRKFVKLSKAEVNELFKEVSLDNESLGLAMKLIYVYGRNVSEVYNVKKSDINFEEGTIRFYMNNDAIVYPIHKDIENHLKSHCELYKNCTYLFDDLKGNPLTKIKDGINYSLHKRSERLMNLSFLDNVRLTSRDFKILRGQHLFLDGVDIKTIHELYHNTNIDGTKKTICYSELKEFLFVNNLDDVFSDCTHLDFYKEHDFSNNPIYYVSSDDGYDALIEVSSYNTVSIIGNKDMEVDLNMFLSNHRDVLSKLSILENSGEYFVVDGFKFMRN